MYLLLELLNKTKEMNASDLHLTVGLAPTIRCNGKLIQLGIDKLSSNDLERFSREILQEKYDEYIEIGEFDTSYSVEGVGRFRINVFKEKNNDAIAIRVIALKIPTLNELNHPEVLKSIINKKRGLILVTGPTGSGKSTTLAAMINEINNTREEHIITLEDPIEYLHNHNKCIINQREIGRDSKSYNKALKAVLREDPDVILVGEMRDLETISIAITAAETGHLILSTLHTLGAANTIDRVIDAFPPNQQQQIRTQLSMVLDAVICQQLVPTLDGGERPVFEIMFLNNAIRNMIRESKTHQIDGIIATSQEEGMISMDNSLLALYRQNVISKDTAIIYSSNAELMEKKMARI